MNRRDFIGAGSGAFFIAAAGRALGAAAPSNRVRIALVGSRKGGRGAEIRAAALELLQRGVEIASVCDVDTRPDGMPFAAAHVAGKQGFAPKQVRDYRNVLEDPSIDAVVLVTPDHWHAPGAVMAMQAGKHVYVEKPCAFCPDEAEKLVQVWRKTGKVLQVGTQRRSGMYNIAALRDIRENKVIGETKWGKCWFVSGRKPLGKLQRQDVPRWLDWEMWQGPAPRRPFTNGIVHYDWHWSRHWGTGESGNNSVHYLDLAREALGVDYPLRTVAGGGKLWIPQDDGYEWPDLFNLTFEFPGAKALTWEGVSTVRALPYRNVFTGAVVFGTKGSVLFKPNNTAEMFDSSGRSVKLWAPAGQKDGKFEHSTASGGTGDTTAEHIFDMVSCIRDNAPLRCCANAETGAKSTMLPLLANIAQTTGETVWSDPATGRLRPGSAGAALWAREYEKGWEIKI